MAMRQMHVGIDDTDSVRGMCTTFLAYSVAAGLLGMGARFLEYPRLVRLNPNVPWKTRGNGAVALRFMAKDTGRVRQYVTDMVRAHADTANGANPGAVFWEGDNVPPTLRRFAREALHRIVRIGDARKMVEEAGGSLFCMGTGRGIVGAAAAIGYEFGDSTAELISYRRDSCFGTPRKIEPDSVRIMQEATYPDTFNSYDDATGHVLIAPRGPDPVFYGLRGESARAVRRASRMVSHSERLRGHMIFRTNQGTGDHLAFRIDPDTMEPHSSGVLEGAVVGGPQIVEGGHLFFDVAAGRSVSRCWAYKPTGLPFKLKGLACGDHVTVGGGVRAGSATFSKSLNVEIVRVQRLAPLVSYCNPRCERCGKSMKSQGRGQGFRCVRCGRTAENRRGVRVPRAISEGEHCALVGAHRHLSRPPQRRGRLNHVSFEPDIEWLSMYDGK